MYYDINMVSKFELYVLKRWPLLFYQTVSDISVFNTSSSTKIHLFVFVSYNLIDVVSFAENY